MAEQTSHYGLNKPGYDDSADIEVINGNMDTIDTQIYNANTSVRSIATGGTGASSASAARTNLGLGDVLTNIGALQTDVGALQTALGSVKLIMKNCAKSSSLSFTFSGQCNFVIFTAGGVQALRSTIYGNCQSGGTVSATKVNAASSSDLTLTTSVSNKLTITNGNTSYQLNVLLISINNGSNIS